MTINYVNVLGLDLDNTTGVDHNEDFIVLTPAEHLPSFKGEVTPSLVDTVKGTVSDYWYNEARRRAIEEYGNDEETSEFLEELLEENEARAIWDSGRRDYAAAVAMFAEYGIMVFSPEEMMFDM